MSKFTVTHESIYPEFRKQQVIEAKDGGASTMKYLTLPKIPTHILVEPLLR